MLHYYKVIEISDYNTFEAKFDIFSNPTSLNSYLDFSISCYLAYYLHLA